MYLVLGVYLIPGVSGPKGGVCSGGCLPLGGVWLGGAWSGVCVWSKGVSAPKGGGIPACTEADTPLWTESQTPVKHYLGLTSLQPVMIFLCF